MMRILNRCAECKVKAHIVQKTYEIGRKYSEGFKENMRIIFDEYLGKWNYRAQPLKHN